MSPNRSGSDELEAAEGVVTILNSNMANAIRSQTVQRGLDPRGFSLVALGGAGPLHAAEVAAMLDIPTVIVPPHPGITSAAGLLTTDLKYDAVKTAFQTSDSVDAAKLNADFAWLEDNLIAQFTADGFDRDRIGLIRAGDLRFVGQGYELRVEFPAGPIDEAALAGVWQAFERQHRTEYGHVFADSPIEIVNIRLTGTANMPKIGRTGANRRRLTRRGQAAHRLVQLPGRWRAWCASTRRITGAMQSRPASRSRGRRWWCSATRPRWCRRAGPRQPKPMAI